MKSWKVILHFVRSVTPIIREWWELMLMRVAPLASTCPTILIDPSNPIRILMKFFVTCGDILDIQSTLINFYVIYLLFSFDRGKRVDETLKQTLNRQLPPTVNLVQSRFSINCGVLHASAVVIVHCNYDYQACGKISCKWSHLQLDFDKHISVFFGISRDNITTANIYPGNKKLGFLCT